MAWLADHSIQLAFLLAYLAILGWHGWKGQRKARSLDDFLIGGGSLGGIIIALSYYATFVSSVTFIGHAGKSYTRGPAWWITCVVVFTSMVFIAWFWVAPPFVRMAKQHQALTIPEFLGARYQSRLLRWLAALVVVSASIAYMVAVYDGAARSLSSLIEIDGRLIMLIIFVVVTTYTLAGGFHSVVATDAVQGLILLSAAAVIPAAMVLRKGGFGPLLDAARQNDPQALQLAAWPELITMFGLALGVGFKFIVEPRQLSRFYGLASNTQIRRGRWLAPALLFLTNLFMLPVGFLAHAFIRSPRIVENADGKIETDLVVPYLLGPELNLLGPYLGAFFLTGLVAAAMSSLDSVLLVAASSVDHDLIHPERDASQAMHHTRGWIVVLSAVAALLALWSTRGIVEISSFSGSMYAACFLPTLVFGLYWRRATRAGALAALLLGFVVTLVWFFAKVRVADGAYRGWHEVYVGLACSLLAYFAVSMLTRPPEQGPPAADRGEATV